LSDFWFSGGPVFGGPGNPGGSKKVENAKKPEKGSKNPPAKTPYDAKSGCLNALTTFLEVFSSCPVFGGVFFSDFWGFPDF